jgi:hypothetical protein
LRRYNKGTLPLDEVRRRAAQFANDDPVGDASQFSRVPQMAVNSAQICDLE